MANVESSSIDRDVTGEPNIVNVSPSIVNMEDNIDFVSSTFEPIEDEVKEDIESEDIINENTVSEVLDNDNNNDVSSDDLANLVNDQLIEKRKSNSETPIEEKRRYNKMLASLNKTQLQDESKKWGVTASNKNKSDLIDGLRWPLKKKI